MSQSTGPIDPITLEQLKNLPIERTTGLGTRRYNSHSLADYIMSSPTYPIMDPMTRDVLDLPTVHRITKKARRTGWSASVSVDRNSKITIPNFLFTYGTPQSVKDNTYIHRILDLMLHVAYALRTDPLTPHTTIPFTSPKVPYLTILVSINETSIRRIIFEFGHEKHHVHTVVRAYLIPRYEILYRQFHWSTGSYTTTTEALGYQRPKPVSEYLPTRFPKVLHTPIVVIMACCAAALDISLGVPVQPGTMSIVEFVTSVILPRPRKSDIVTLLQDMYPGAKTLRDAIHIIMKIIYTSGVELRVRYESMATIPHVPLNDSFPIELELYPAGTNVKQWARGVVQPLTISVFSTHLVVDKHYLEHLIMSHNVW